MTDEERRYRELFNVYHQVCADNARLREANGQLHARPARTRIEVEVCEDVWRQAYAEREDNGDDLSRNFTWLRLPEDARRALLKLMGTMSLNDLMARGLTREEALTAGDLYFALG
jgi:hypothetical protein